MPRQVAPSPDESRFSQMFPRRHALRTPCSAPAEALVDAWRQDPAYRVAFDIAEASFAELFRAFRETTTPTASRERALTLPRRRVVWRR